MARHRARGEDLCPGRDVFHLIGVDRDPDGSVRPERVMAGFMATAAGGSGIENRARVLDRRMIDGMDPNTEKRRAYNCVKELLSRGDEDSIRYAALELRRCLEAVVYEKLWAYRNRIPVEVARRWQPPQAFKALLLMEPDADQTFTVAVAKEHKPGVMAQGPRTTLGTDLRPQTSWLRKTHNKIGSFLHAKSPFELRDGQSDESRAMQLREFFEKTIPEVEPFVLRDLTFTLAMEVSFICSVCGTEIKANARGIEQTREVTCLNPECECRFFAVKAGDDFTFYLDASTAPCPECKAEIQLPTQQLREGYQFSCSSCACKFELTSPKWEFRKREATAV